MTFSIRLMRLALEDLEKVPAREQARILDVIENALTHEPLKPSRHKKLLAGLAPPWEQLRPVWQLRVEPYRVFYDVDPEERQVLVRAVRLKGRRRTEEIL